MYRTGPFGRSNRSIDLWHDRCLPLYTCPQGTFDHSWWDLSGASTGQRWKALTRAVTYTGLSFHYVHHPRAVEQQLDKYIKKHDIDFLCYWQNYFDSDLRAMFKQRYGELLTKLGYERDDEW